MKAKTRSETCIKDVDVRPILVSRIIRKLKAQYKRDRHPFSIIPEFTICSGDARADIATVNGELCGYEIKSDADSLDRLPRQIAEYNKVFDRVTIVVGEKLLYGALDLIPDWWGIILFRATYNDVQLFELRSSLKNPSQDYISVVNLLTKKEIIDFYKVNRLKGYSGKNKSCLCASILRSADRETVLSYTRQRLAEMHNDSRSVQLLSLCDA